MSSTLVFPCLICHNFDVCGALTTMDTVKKVFNIQSKEDTRRLCKIKVHRLLLHLLALAFRSW